MDMATGSERNTLETPVLIVGSGPVGFALALDPGWRGVACTLVEHTDGRIAMPKMNVCCGRMKIDQLGVRRISSLAMHLTLPARANGTTEEQGEKAIGLVSAAAAPIGARRGCRAIDLEPESPQTRGFRTRR